MFRIVMSSLLVLLSLLAIAGPARSAGPATPRPTVVLVHGAFADASSWNAVATRLVHAGYPVVAVANPLRGVAHDASYTARVLDGIPGPVVLVGHSYGGSVISTAAVGKPQVKALVFVSAFAPEAGESAATLSNKFPGSTLGQALAAPVPQEAGVADLYIRTDKFWQQFAADVPQAEAVLMAVGQRPITDAALGEANAGTAWKTVPSWFVYGTGDRNIPPAALAWMAERAQSKRTVAIPGASHVPQVSHAREVASLIEAAAR